MPAKILPVVTDYPNISTKACSRVLVCPGEVLLPDHLPPRFRTESKARPSVTFEIGTPLHEIEHEMILRVLSVSGNNRKKAADILGISRRTLYNKLDKYGIS